MHIILKSPRRREVDNEREDNYDFRLYLLSRDCVCSRKHVDIHIIGTTHSKRYGCDDFQFIFNGKNS
jgi:hypothetical protein